MKLFYAKRWGLVFLICLILIVSPKMWPENWVFYGASRSQINTESTLMDWYVLNRTIPVSKDQAAVNHFYDRESLTVSSPFSGGIVRVWEKSVLQGPVKSYKEAREEVEREREEQLMRKLTSIDQGWVFPLAVKRATKEIHTLFKINRDSGEFLILEVNYYDSEGERITRELNSVRAVWHHVAAGTIMEELFLRIHKKQKHDNRQE